MHYVKEIMFGLTMLEFFFAFYCLFQWRRWERAYFNLRGYRDPELAKKTQCLPYQLPLSKYND